MGLSWYGVDKTTSFDIKIYSADGRVVSRTTRSVTSGGNVINLNISNLQPGMYYIRAINTENGINIQQKFSKQ